MPKIFTPLSANVITEKSNVRLTNSFRPWLPLGAFLGKASVLLALALVFCLMGMPEANAWGPGVHMVTGNWLLQNLTALPVDVAASIMAHPGQFLYGILSPDIFIGKGSLSKKGHSHNWQTGLLLLRLATTAEQQAYAYGYLSHLAADTVAHNVFVPQSSEGAFGSGRLAHVYLEMQADRALDWDSKDALAVFKERPSAASAALLQKTMRQTPWTFWMKKFLFKQSIFFGGLPSWRSAMGFLDSVVVGPEGVAFAEQMLVVSTRAMVSLLQDVRNSPVRTLDPIGAEALEGFRGQSRNLVQNLMEQLFPGIMQKHWANALFYTDTFAPRAEKNFDIVAGMPHSSKESGAYSTENNNGARVLSASEISPKIGTGSGLGRERGNGLGNDLDNGLDNGLEDTSGIQVGSGRKNISEAAGGNGSGYAVGSESGKASRHKSGDASGPVMVGKTGLGGEQKVLTNADAIPELDDIPELFDDAVTEKMEFLHTLDSGSPIIEKGFTLPQVLRDLPPVCVP